MNGKSLMFSIFPAVHPSGQKTDHAFSFLLAPFSFLLCPLPRSPEGALEINRGCDPRLSASRPSGACPLLRLCCLLSPVLPFLSKLMSVLSKTLGTHGQKRRLNYQKDMNF